ncbi:hypothetical protein M5K25_011940 [Dendrobium thyrsiflorum]|uniref:Uncharacterized protein n=1 Tax=Dendrobium thyrsiflorum TaxID=117978 RepID=A0ABD0V3M3_DENTH
MSFLLVARAQELTDTNTSVRKDHIPADTLTKTDSKHMQTRNKESYHGFSEKDDRSRDLESQVQNRGTSKIIGQEVFLGHLIKQKSPNKTDLLDTRSLPAYALGLSIHFVFVVVFIYASMQGVLHRLLHLREQTRPKEPNTLIGACVFLIFFTSDGGQVLAKRRDGRAGMRVLDIYLKRAGFEPHHRHACGRRRVTQVVGRACRQVVPVGEGGMQAGHPGQRRVTLVARSEGEPRRVARVGRKAQLGWARAGAGPA